MTSLGLFKYKKDAAFVAVIEPFDLVKTISFQLGTGKDFEVDWGDGTPIAYTNFTTGIVPTGTITVTSSDTGLQFRLGGNRNAETISITGGGALSDLSSAFDSLTYVAAITDISIDDTSNVTKWALAFSYNTHWTNVNDFWSNWDFSAADDFESIFEGCSGITTTFPSGVTLPSSLTALVAAFSDCSGMTSFPAWSFPSSIVDFSYCWSGCSGMTSFGAGDFSAAENLDFCWNGCTALTAFPSINLSAATTCRNAWNGCTSMTAFPALDISICTDFFAAWKGCSALATMNAATLTAGTNFTSAWENCTALATFSITSLPACTTLIYAFNNCVGFTAFGNLSATSCLVWTQTFRACENVVTIGNLGTEGGTTFTSMFANCFDLESIGAIDTTGTSGATSGMFTNCSSLTSPDSTDQGLLASASGYDFN